MQTYTKVCDYRAWLKHPCLSVISRKSNKCAGCNKAVHGCKIFQNKQVCMHAQRLKSTPRKRVTPYRVLTACAIADMYSIEMICKCHLLHIIRPVRLLCFILDLNHIGYDLHVAIVWIKITDIFKKRKHSYLYYLFQHQDTNLFNSKTSQSGFQLFHTSLYYF